MTGGFVFERAQHDLLKSGSTVKLTNSSGEELEIRLVADFPNSIPAPTPLYAEDIRNGNPFGVVIVGQPTY